MQIIYHDKELYDTLTHSTPDSAGVDLKSTVNMLIQPGERAIINTGVAIYLGKNSGLFGLIAPRSGLGSHGFILSNTVGIIDADYQDELKLLCWNAGKEWWTIRRGQRIAQYIIMNYTKANFSVVDDFSEETERRGGFGSTGE